jgi:hypothetical protein
MGQKLQIALGLVLLVHWHWKRRATFNETCSGGAFDFTGNDPIVSADIIKFHQESSVFIRNDILNDHAAHNVPPIGNFYKQAFAAKFFNLVSGFCVGVKLQQLRTPPLMLTFRVWTLNDQIKDDLCFAHLHLSFKYNMPCPGMAGELFFCIWAEILAAM